MTPIDIYNKLIEIGNQVDELKPHLKNIDTRHAVLFGFVMDLPIDNNGGVIVYTNSQKAHKTIHSKLA